MGKNQLQPWYHTARGRLGEDVGQDGNVPKRYPFLDPMEDLLYSRGSRLRCGAGHINYSIMTDGNIAPCPVMVGMKDYYLGHIGTSDPVHLPSSR